MYSHHNRHGQQRRHDFSLQPPLPNAVTAPTTPVFAPTPFDQLTARVNNLAIDMAFPETQHHVHRLNGFVISTTALQKAGYITYPLGAKDLEMKKRCGRCHKAMFKGMRRKQPKTPPKKPLTEEQLQNCNYHPGRVANRAWTCCNKPLPSPPCASSPDHIESNISAIQLAHNWQYHVTPDFTSSRPPLTAISLDCEMGTAESGESELIRLTALDFFTGQVLIDSLVYPDVRMAHYNTRFSGVTRADMEAARRNRTCLFGRDAAREALWEYVSPETVVVGHGANGDFSCLRWIHTRVVDTYIMEMYLQKKMDKEREKELEMLVAEAQETAEKGEAVVDVKIEVEELKSPKHPGLGLKKLAWARLGREIQKGGRGHDSHEDALATRDLLKWHIEADLL